MGTKREVIFSKYTTKCICGLAVGKEKYNIMIDEIKVNDDEPRTDIYIYKDENAYRIFVDSYRKNISDGKMYLIISEKLEYWVEQYKYFNQYAG